MNPADVTLTFPAKDLDSTTTVGGAGTALLAVLDLHPVVRLLLHSKSCRSRRKRSHPDSGEDDDDDDGGETASKQQQRGRKKTDDFHHPWAQSEVYSALTACLRAAVEAGREDRMTIDLEHAAAAVAAAAAAESADSSSRTISLLFLVIPLLAD